MSFARRYTCARGRVPRVEDGAVRAAQLLARVLREPLPRLLLVDRRERRDQLAEVVGGEVDVLCDSARGLQVGECLLEAVPVDAVDDLAVHLDEPAVRVEREARGCQSRPRDPRPPRRSGRG